jgi:hypothetical protein
VSNIAQTGICGHAILFARLGFPARTSLGLWGIGNSVPAKVPIGFPVLVGRRENVEMSDLDEIGQARERMLYAEAELDRHIHGGEDDSGKFTQLSQALKTSRDRYIDQLESLCPPFHE